MHFKNITLYKKKGFAVNESKTKIIVFGIKMR